MPARYSVEELLGVMLAADTRLRMFPAWRRKLVVAKTLPLLPSRERIVRAGQKRCVAQLRAAVKDSLLAQGVIGVFLGALLWEFLISLCVALLLRWIMRDGAEARLIERVKACGNIEPN